MDLVITIEFSVSFVKKQSITGKMHVSLDRQSTTNPVEWVVEHSARKGDGTNATDGICKRQRQIMSSYNYECIILFQIAW